MPILEKKKQHKHLFGREMFPRPISVYLLCSNHISLLVNATIQTAEGFPRLLLVVCSRLNAMTLEKLNFRALT